MRSVLRPRRGRAVLPLRRRDRSPEGKFACVVDEHPRFHMEALRWFTSLTRIAGVDVSDITISVVGTTQTDALRWLADRGVDIQAVDPFDSRSPHCNKISGAQHLARDPVEGTVVLCDTDIAVLKDPRSVRIPRGAVASKPVDAPLPPIEVLEPVFAAASVPAPGSFPLPWNPGRKTLRGNGNGGLYLVPGPLLGRVAGSWAEWATWLLDRPSLLGGWGLHVDQVAMALALAAEKIKWVPLDVQWNTPVHDGSRIPPDPPRPAVIHYHQEIASDGSVLPTGNPVLDERISIVNKAVENEFPDGFPVETFRKWQDSAQGARQA